MSDYFVHSSSFVDQPATIGNGTKIWHFCHVLAHAQIGEKCILGQNVQIGSRVKIGNGVKIQNNISVYEGVEIEDECFLGPSMVFTNVFNPRAFIERKNEFRKTLLKKGCSIGANATIVCGVTLGEYCLIGAGAVVTKDVPPFALITGVPGKISGWISKAGNKLHFNNKNIATDPFDNTQYQLKNNQCEVLQ